MKTIKKITTFAAAILCVAAIHAFDTCDFANNSSTYVSKISKGLNDFSDELAIAIPQAATQQNVWADAYIGKLFPSIPFHLGGGFNAAFTHIDTSGLSKAAKTLGISGIKDDYYYPVFTADLRIGGVFLPFDIGIAVMKTGTIGTDAFGCDLDIDLFTIGFDFRYALLEGGLIMPKLSVGFGYFYNEGSFGAGSSTAETSVDYKVHTMYAQAQVSKKILFLTPFLGLRALVVNYENDWDWHFKGDVASKLANNEITVANSGKNSSDGFDFGELQPQIFAGVGVNFLVLQATASVTADLRNIGDSGLWSGAFSIRIKI